MFSRLIYLLLIVFGFSVQQSLLSMEQDSSIEEKKLYEEQWQAIKNRVALFKQLKAKFKPPEIYTPMSIDFIPQSLIHLKEIFGKDKSEEELIVRAIESFYGDTPYESTVKLYGSQLVGHAKSIIDHEKKFHEYYVSYHGQKSSLGIIDDVMQELYGWFNIDTPNSQTKFARLFTAEPSKEFETVDDFLNSVKKYMDPNVRGIFDHRPTVITNLLPVNLALFANIKNPTENSWYFYVTATNITPPEVRNELLNFFKFFNFNPTYVDKILALHQEFLEQLKFNYVARGKTHLAYPGILLQIFMEPEIIDKIAYLASAGGYFYDFDVNDSTLWFLSQYYRNGSELLQQPEWKNYVTQQYQHLKTKIFSHRLQRSLLSSFLKIYRTSPQEIPLDVLDMGQGRIYLKYSTLIDPFKVKIFKYIMHPDKIKLESAEKIYKQQLSKIIETMIHDWVFSNPDITKAKIARLFSYIREQLRHQE